MAEMTQEYARLLFSYDAETGVLCWRERPADHFTDESYWLRWNARYAGQPTGNLGNMGYLRVNLNGKLYTNHRLIWLLIYGEWPDRIDHINGIKTDNRLANLRSVDALGNSRNLALPVSNTSGVIGVSFDKSTGKWHAYIGVGGNIRKTLGLFETKEEAAAARRGAEKVLGYHENHGRAA